MGFVRAASSFAKRPVGKSTHALSVAHSDASHYITPALKNLYGSKLVTGVEPATY
jgi:hypothetical protein